MTPWWWVSLLVVALPVYLALRRGRTIWIVAAACAVGLALGAVLEGLLFVADRLMAGNAVTFADAVAKAVTFPQTFLLGLLLVVAGVLNPELPLLLPRVVQDILAGSTGSELRRLKISLQVVALVAAVVVPLVAALDGRRAVRWPVLAAGSLVVTAARMGAGYLHYKDQGIVVIRNDPPWIIVLYDINWVIVTLLQTFLQIGLAYLILRALIHLVRRASGSGSAGPAGA